MQNTVFTGIELCNKAYPSVPALISSVDKPLIINVCADFILAVFYERCNVKFVPIVTGVISLCRALTYKASVYIKLVVIVRRDADMRP